MKLENENKESHKYLEKKNSPEIKLFINVKFFKFSLKSTFQSRLNAFN